VVTWYQHTDMTRGPRSHPTDDSERRSIERVQTGVRLEKRILLVLKALAASHDLSLGDLLEGIVLHAFEGAAPFGPESISKVNALKKVYGLNLDARDSHLLIERAGGATGRRKGGRHG
jgi:hypothetical protein